MSPDPTHETASTTEGPSLLEERSIGGILVHFLAIPTGVVGAGLVYLVSTNDFTRRNARNALDWHLTVLAFTVLTFGSLFTYAEVSGQGVTDVAVLPSAITTAAGLVVAALVSLWMGVGLWTFLVGFVAMGKATFGTAWRYPLTPAVVDRLAPRVGLPGGWPALLVAYVVVAPLVVGGVFVAPEGGAGFFAVFFGLFALVTVLTPLAGVAMYLHGERARPPDADWQPHVVAYVGAPIAVAVAGYLLSGTFTDSINPAGDATYVLVAALWVSALVYVVRWRLTSS